MLEYIKRTVKKLLDMTTLDEQIADMLPHEVVDTVLSQFDRLDSMLEQAINDAKAEINMCENDIRDIQAEIEANKKTIEKAENGRKWLSPVVQG